MKRVSPYLAEMFDYCSRKPRLHLDNYLNYLEEVRYANKLWVGYLQRSTKVNLSVYTTLPCRSEMEKRPLSQAPRERSFIKITYKKKKNIDKSVEDVVGDDRFHLEWEL